MDYFDAYALGREYLIGDAFLAKYRNISRDFIWQEQNERFKRLLARAWRMAFYRRLWGEHGVKPGDIVIKMGEYEVTDMMGYMQGLSKFKKGDTTIITIIREKETIELEVTF